MITPTPLPPEDRPLRIRLTEHGIKLAFYHRAQPLPPFKVSIPLEQWEQLLALLFGLAPDVADFEAYLGFTPETLALHRIDAEELHETLTPFQPNQETKTMTTRQKQQLVTRVLTLSDKARAIYQKKDELFGRLLDGAKTGETIQTERGEFIIHDNFDGGRNVGFRPASFHRFELKEVKASKRAKPTVEQEPAAIADENAAPIPPLEVAA